MKKMKRLILMMAMVGLAIFLLNGIASAALFTFTQPELLGMVESFDDPVGIGDLTYTSPDGDGAVFVGNILDGVPQWRSIGLGFPAGSVPASAQDLSAYDGYKLNFINNNNQGWWVNLFVITGPNDLYESEWIHLLVGDSADATLDFATAGVTNVNDVKNIGFQIAFNEPLTTVPGGSVFQGDQYHMRVNTVVQPVEPVPEPGTLMLLGSGLLGIAGYAKVRFGGKRKKLSN